MPGYTPTVRRSVEDDQQAADRDGLPIEAVVNQLRGEAAFHIEPADRVIDGRELSLDLNDQGRAARALNREDVNRSSLPEFGVSDLDLDLPTQAG